MTIAISIDTLAYAKRLMQAGCNQPLAEELAEAQSELVSNLIDNTLVTKEDLRLVETKLESRMDKLEYGLLIKLGGLIVISIGAATTILGLIMRT